MQNKIDAVTARMEEAEGRISEIEDKIMENDEAERRKERKILDHEGRIRELHDSMKCNNYPYRRNSGRNHSQKIVQNRYKQYMLKKNLG